MAVHRATCIRSCVEPFYILPVPCTSAHKSGAIYVINPKTKSVEKIYDTVGTGVAAGVPCSAWLGVGSPGRTLLSAEWGWRHRHTDDLPHHETTTGAVLATFNQAGGSDEVYFDKGNNTYFLAMSSWTSSGKTGKRQSHPSLGIHQCRVVGQRQ